MYLPPDTAPVLMARHETKWNIMFKNYFTTALRNFQRNKAFSIINVLGLSIGISASLVIFLIVYYEFSYDKYQPDNNRIYRVVLDAKFGDADGHSAGVPAPLGKAIQTEVTGVALTVPIFQFQGDATAKVSIEKPGASSPNIIKSQPNIIFTSHEYFGLLPHKWLAGSPKSSLQNPFSVVLTESRARQYFPGLNSDQVMGQKLNYNDDITATVTGVVADLNETTSFNAVEFISLATISQTHLQNQFMMDVWNDWMAYSQLYVKINEGTSRAQIETQLKALENKYNKKAADDHNTITYALQPLKDVHFNGLYPGIGQRVARVNILYGLLAIAAFLLLLGCINFINLTTANATQRAKEIGIRKTMGSSRRQLVLQFLGETLLTTVMATLVSMCLSPILLQMFKDYIPQGLNFELIQQPFVIAFLVGLTLFVSFISGIYPSLILSGYRPALVLKSQSTVNPGDTRRAWTRKTLTVAQFVVAQFFIIATIIVSKQINYSINADLGFNKDGIINFELPRDTVQSHQTHLLQEIKNIPEVEVASSGFFAPADEGVAFTNVSYAPKKDLKAQVQIRWGNPEFIDVYKIKLIAGRNVLPSDTMREFLINNTYAKLLGFQNPNDAVGIILNFGKRNLPVVGVMQDFHDQSTHSPIFPIVFASGNGSMFHVRLKPSNPGGQNWKNAINKMQAAFKKIYPDASFDYKFYDEKIAKMYATEQQTAGLLTWATGLSIFISCLGLLGLVMFTINSRTKEIGVRKILGASVSNIVKVLSTDFVKLVCVAFIIAAPLAWITMNKWLEDFTYRTSISWWVFLLSGGMMILVAILTLSFQTIKAALVNPVKSLRTE
ncbi:MAG: hypothetical protein C5B52_19025 [Bacteroidetes bacterium]|nr:MAG: hypothetical protein C5B52_19025 [Bacteroidota bacterium]